MIHPTDKNAKFQGIFEDQDEISAYEHNLFHWLELNTFMAEQHDRDGFVGLFRFEDLYVDSAKKLTSLLEGLMGSGDFDMQQSPVDRVQKKLPAEIKKPNPRLLDEVTKAAIGLGYSEKELTDVMDWDLLNERYSKVRL